MCSLASPASLASPSFWKLIEAPSGLIRHGTTAHSRGNIIARYRGAINGRCRGGTTSRFRGFRCHDTFFHGGTSARRYRGISGIGGLLHRRCRDSCGPCGLRVCRYRDNS